MDSTSVPIAVETPQYHAVLRHALDEAERTCADRVQTERITCLTHSPWREHDPCPIRQLCEQSRVGYFQVKLHRQCIDHIDALDAGNITLSQAAFGGKVT